ncbi:zinc metalloprotease HtpX [Candidatus Woesearchaeota archaeon]|nr:zinc metalloprotease HtpX [Candidatus Woesearchaeota archaeon]
MFKNQLKTVVLLSLLTALMLWAGTMLGGQAGLVIGLVLALIMNVGSYWFSDKIVLSMYRAKEITHKQAPDLFDMVKDVAHRAKLPMPKVYIVPGPTPNAFATGRDPKHSAVAVTEGILQLLDKEELRGVIAHEMSHIKNRDVLISTIAATVAGVISYVASMAQWAALFGGLSRNDDNGPGMFELLVLMILTPILATIIQFAISRSREFQADASAAHILRDSKGLASALQKLEAGVKHVPLRHGPQTGASLFIVNPFTAQNFIQLFSTHPSTKARVEALQALPY